MENCFRSQDFLWVEKVSVKTSWGYRFSKENKQVICWANLNKSIHSPRGLLQINAERANRHEDAQEFLQRAFVTKTSHPSIIIGGTKLLYGWDFSINRWAMKNWERHKITKICPMTVWSDTIWLIAMLTRAWHPFLFRVFVALPKRSQQLWISSHSKTGTPITTGIEALATMKYHHRRSWCPGKSSNRQGRP